MRGFQLTISTILILVVLLVTTVLVLFFFTNVFGTTGFDIANIAGSLGPATEDLAGECDGGECEGGELEDIPFWANPFRSGEGE